MNPLRYLCSLGCTLLFASCASTIGPANHDLPGIGPDANANRDSTAAYHTEMPPPAGRSLYVSDADVDRVIDSRLPAADRAIIRQKLLLLPASWRGAGLIYTSLDGHLYATSIELLNTERLLQRMRHPLLPADQTTAMSANLPDYTNACPTQNLGGEGTGPFRRVYIGCDGYNTQIITFNDGVKATNGCRISDTLPLSDWHNILAGAYMTNGSGTGIDAGVVFLNGSTPSWEPVTKFGSKYQYGTNYGCNGSFQIVLQDQAGSNGENDFILATTFTDSSGIGHTDPPIMQGVPSTEFPTSGTGYVFRRLFGIAQKPENDTSGEWFGFAPNSNSGPNLSSPEILFTSTTVSGGTRGGNNQVQFNYNSNAYGERSPAVYNQTTDVICSEGPSPPWQSSNFDTDEGINLSNSNASGTMPGTPCAVNQ